LDRKAFTDLFATSRLNVQFAKRGGISAENTTTSSSLAPASASHVPTGAVKEKVIIIG
jgi:hypothetical protein